MAIINYDFGNPLPDDRCVLSFSQRTTGVVGLLAFWICGGHVGTRDRYHDGISANSGMLGHLYHWVGTTKIGHATTANVSKIALPISDAFFVPNGLENEIRSGAALIAHAPSPTTLSRPRQNEIGQGKAR